MSPCFLMGHSMGGALTLAFATRKGPEWPHPSPETVSLFSGIIVTSPLINLTKPASSIQRWIGSKVAVIAPRIIIPAVIKGEDLSRDPEVGKLVTQDPLVKQVGSLRGLSDMLKGGEDLIAESYKNWPKTLPLLMIHGTCDLVTSPNASKTFHDKVVAVDKTLSLYEGCYHELHNEIDGTQEKLLDELTTWIEAHLSSGAVLAKL